MNCSIFKFKHFIITVFLLWHTRFIPLYFRNVGSSMNSRFSCKDVRFTTDNIYIVCVTFFSRYRSFFALAVDNSPIVVEKFSTPFPLRCGFQCFLCSTPTNFNKKKEHYPNALLEHDGNEPVSPTRKLDKCNSHAHVKYTVHTHIYLQ